MNKDWYDKYGKEYHCADCVFLDDCMKNSEPLYGRCCEQFLRNRIAELEEQLKNAIVPKFKKGQEVWIIFDRTLFGEKLISVENTKVLGIYVEDCINYSLQTLPCIAREKEIFATKEEAQAKLEELQGE